MKILFVSHRIPYPPNKGEKIMALHALKHLSKKHEVSLVSLYDDKKDRQYADKLKPFCSEISLFYNNPFLAKIKCAVLFFLNRPLTLGYFHSFKMKAKIKELLKVKKFDLIFAYSSSSAQYVMDAEVKKVMDFVDCDSAKWRQYSISAKFPMSWIYNRECMLLKRYEKKVIGKFDRFIVITEAEKKEFSEFSETGKFTVITAGVDTDFFRPAGTKKADSLIFTGAMDYFANIDAVTYFCTEVLPLIKKDCPGVKFHVVGHRPTPAVSSLAGIKGVTVSGSVEDIRTYLDSAEIFVAPMRIAQGVQNKILEAMASGLPVVTTSKVLKGLKAKADRDLFVADTSEDFKAKVIMLLRNKELRDSMSAAARRYVEESHNWERNLATLDEVLNTTGINRKNR